MNPKSFTSTFGSSNKEKFKLLYEEDTLDKNMFQMESFTLPPPGGKVSLRGPLKDEQSVGWLFVSPKDQMKTLFGTVGTHGAAAGANASEMVELLNKDLTKEQNAQLNPQNTKFVLSVLTGTAPEAVQLPEQDKIDQAMQDITPPSKKAAPAAVDIGPIVESPTSMPGSPAVAPKPEAPPAIEFIPALSETVDKLREEDSTKIQADTRDIKATPFHFAGQHCASCCCVSVFWTRRIVCEVRNAGTLHSGSGTHLHSRGRNYCLGWDFSC